jgi:hypothetical protein
VITIFFFSLGGISTGIIGIHSAIVKASLMMETAEKRRNPRPPGWASILSYFFFFIGDLNRDCFAQKPNCLQIFMKHVPMRIKEVSLILKNGHGSPLEVELFAFIVVLVFFCSIPPRVAALFLLIQDRKLPV